MHTYKREILDNHVSMERELTLESEFLRLLWGFNLTVLAFSIMAHL
jgi:hypothetical protein